MGDRLGVINPMRWSKATEWLLKKNGVADVDNAIDPLMGFDQTNLWQPPANLLHGNEIGRSALQDAKESAAKFERTYGRRPSLGVIRVGGVGTRYEHSKRRLQLYSNPSNSWFMKTDVGKANGFDVTEIELDAASTTTGSLLGEIYRLRDAVDGVQVMWPLPEHIDSARVFNAVPLSKDVDGIHFASWGSNFPPVTPAGVMELMKGHNVDVRGKQSWVEAPSLALQWLLCHAMRAPPFPLHTNRHTMRTRRHFETLCRSVIYSFRVQVLLVPFMRIGSKRELS